MLPTANHCAFSAIKHETAPVSLLRKNLSRLGLSCELSESQVNPLPLGFEFLEGFSGAERALAGGLRVYNQGKFLSYH